MVPAAFDQLHTRRLPYRDAGAATLGTDWKERAPEEGPYLGVMITPDASLVYAGGSEIFVRSWDREIHWGNRPARVAAMSDDGKRVVMAVGNKLSVLDNKGIENWSRNHGRVCKDRCDLSQRVVYHLG